MIVTTAVCAVRVSPGLYALWKNTDRRMENREPTPSGLHLSGALRNAAGPGGGRRGATAKQHSRVVSLVHPETSLLSAAAQQVRRARFSFVCREPRPKITGLCVAVLRPCAAETLRLQLQDPGRSERPARTVEPRSQSSLTGRFGGRRSRQHNTQHRRTYTTIANDKNTFFLMPKIKKIADISQKQSITSGYSFIPTVR